MLLWQHKEIYYKMMRFPWNIDKGVVYVKYDCSFSMHNVMKPKSNKDSQNLLFN